MNNTVPMHKSLRFTKEAEDSCIDGIVYEIIIPSIHIVQRSKIDKILAFLHIRVCTYYDFEKDFFFLSEKQYLRRQ